MTVANCKEFVRLVKNSAFTPRILIIGSGSRGAGTEAMWGDADIHRIGIDIYPTSSTDYLADAHYLPFRESSFDGIWIQAVLEHVADPGMVVREIERVMRPAGVVYAETPFMQQVHEGAYDFQRFTVVGHRYLFRNFEAIKFGGNQGTGVVLAWAVRYFFWAIFRSKALAVALSLPFAIFGSVWDRVADKRSLWDGPSGVFFLGKKADRALRQNELPPLYRGMQR